MKEQLKDAEAPEQQDHADQLDACYRLASRTQREVAGGYPAMIRSLSKVFCLKYSLACSTTSLNPWKHGRCSQEVDLILPGHRPPRACLQVER